MTDVRGLCIMQTLPDLNKKLRSIRPGQVKFCAGRNWIYIYIYSQIYTYVYTREPIGNTSSKSLEQDRLQPNPPSRRLLYRPAVFLHHLHLTELPNRQEEIWCSFSNIVLFNVKILRKSKIAYCKEHLYTNIYIYISKYIYIYVKVFGHT
jgi:hypothetical protein